MGPSGKQSWHVDMDKALTSGFHYLSLQSIHKWKVQQSVVGMLEQVSL
jgi:hypothetical protein